LPSLNREQLNDLKELLTERMVDNMSTKDLAEYVADDLFNYFDKLGEHEFLDEAKNYWDDMYDDVVQELIEDTLSLKYADSQYIENVNEIMQEIENNTKFG